MYWIGASIIGASVIGFNYFQNYSDSAELMGNDLANYGARIGMLACSVANHTGFMLMSRGLDGDVGIDRNLAERLVEDVSYLHIGMDLVLVQYIIRNTS